MIVALISWYDERPSWLAAAVSSSARICDHVVCVDGAYENYPGARRASSSGQHEAAVLAAEADGVGLTLHVPDGVWVGDQVAKRAFMFDAGRLVARSTDDWFLILDGDEVLVDIPEDIHDRLAATTCDVAEVGIVDRYDPTRRNRPAPNSRRGPAEPMRCFRRLYRALPDLTVRGTHYGYQAAGLDLWRSVAALDLSDMRIDHRKGRRAPERQEAREGFYATRRARKLEAPVNPRRPAA